MEFPGAKGQVGCPPTFKTGAQLGFSAMAYQSAEIPLSYRGGDGSSLVRAEGSRLRAHPVAKSELARRANLG